MRAISIRLFAFVLSAVVGAPFAGNAAPQILGLVATATPLPLSCVGGVCSAEVSGVCLQEHRPAPAPGTAYRAAEGSELVLVARDRDGVERAESVAGLVEIRSLRLFSALSVSLPEGVVRKLASGGPAFLSVGPMASAVPVADGEPPLTEKEIRTYTGPLRAIAEDVMRSGGANLSAMRSLNLMINRLPADAGADRIAALRDGAMRDRTAADGLGAGLVDRALDTCREMLRVGTSPNLRACIANQHDILNSNTTQDVWRSLRPGS